MQEPLPEPEELLEVLRGEIDIVNYRLQDTLLMDQDAERLREETVLQEREAERLQLEAAELRAAAEQERQRLVGKVGLLKVERNLAPFQPSRFGSMMVKLRERAYMIGLEQKRNQEYFTDLHERSVKFQEASATSDQIIQQ